MPHGADRPAVLEVANLRVELGIGGRWIEALDDVSLTIRRGETLGLVGESGSGKSLTALSVARLLPDNARVTGGSVRVLGEDVMAKGPRELDRMRARSVAFIFQNPTTFLNPVLTVGRQLAELFEWNPELLDPPGGPRAWAARGLRRRAWQQSVECLRVVKIPDPERIVGQYPFELSGGMQQRVVIAMALARRPDLIIADEITTALDVTIQAQILSLLAELRRTLGMTLLLITHDMGIVAQLADRVAVMYSGRVVEVSDVVPLFRQAQHPYSRALLETVPTLQTSRAVFRPIPGAMPALTDPPAGCRFHPRCGEVLPECAAVAPRPIETGPGRTVACHRYGAGA